MDINLDNTKSGILYVVATPIGNLGDITLRAIEVLKEVDFVVCEDTRVTGRLLNNFRIKKKLFSFHQHSSDLKIGHLIKRLLNGETIALVTDSGTPGISDPGAKLVKKAIEYDKIKVISVPGPSAMTAALSISGAPSKDILFIGFLPGKKGRIKKFREIKKYWDNGVTIVLYESPYRVNRTIKEIKEELDKAEITCFREITKKFEEIIKINLYNNRDQIENIVKKGEFTIIIYPKR